MKLIIAVVQDKDAPRLVENLIRRRLQRYKTGVPQAAFSEKATLRCFPASTRPMSIRSWM